MTQRLNVHTPRTIDEITPEWLTSALAARGVFTDCAVRSVEIKRIGIMEGFMGILARLTPQYVNPAGSLPVTLIAKLPDPDPVQRAAQSEAFRTEAGFYSTYPADDRSIHPQTYFVAVDADGDDHAMLIEDLSSGRAASFIRHMPLDDAATVFDVLAGLHVERWNAPELDGLTWAADGRKRATWSPSQEAYSAAWDGFCEKWGAFIPPEVFETAEALTRSLADVLTVEAGVPVTLAHSDTRPENMFFYDDDPRSPLKMIDWQRATIQPGARDLANFVIFSLDPDDRRSAERKLLKGYLERLKTHGITDYSFDDLLADYRRGLLYPLMRMVPHGAKLGPDFPGAEEIGRLMFSRWIAIADWQCEELLP